MKPRKLNQINKSWQTWLILPVINENDVRYSNTEIKGVYQEIANKIVPSKIKNHNIMRKSTVQQNKKRGRMRPKLPWFDAECIYSEIELNRLANCYSQNSLQTRTFGFNITANENAIKS